jgi:hypothetical protein
MKVDDLKVKVVLDDAQAQTALAELLRGAAALEQLLLGMGQALSSPAGQAVVVDALVRRIEELKAERDAAKADLEALKLKRGVPAAAVERGQRIIRLIRECNELRRELDVYRSTPAAQRVRRQPDAPTREVSVKLTEQEIHALELGGELVVVAVPARPADGRGER